MKILRECIAPISSTTKCIQIIFPYSRTRETDYSPDEHEDVLDLSAVLEPRATAFSRWECQMAEVQEGLVTRLNETLALSLSSS